MLATCFAALIAGSPAGVSAAAGSWSIVPNSTSHGLVDITCVTTADCWAVGPTTQHYDGVSWSIVSNPASSAGNLTGVTCVTAADCWAVGSSLGTGGLTEATLVGHYNGSSWTIVASPNPGTSQNRLVNVKCIDASNCWAVGTYWGPGPAHTLIEHYTGGAWVIDGGGYSSVLLLDVACSSLQHDCWAVGWTFASSCPTASHNCTFIEHNPGSGWIAVPSPNAGVSDTLISLTCVSASNCWAVGGYSNGTKSLTLTEHYDGTSWAVVPSPNVAHEQTLFDVSCASASDCWAVGRHNCAKCGSTIFILIEHNIGSGWVVVNNPNLSREDWLMAIKCVNSHDCWAVGEALSLFPTADKTLIEHYT